MATNPMQRKARNSFLLGMLLMLVISGVVIAFLFMQLMNNAKKEKELKAANVNILVLNQDVSSGQVITTDMLSSQEVNRNLVPSNATGEILKIENYSLQDKEGNNIGTIYDKDGNTFLYIKKNNNNCLIEKELTTNNYYMQKNNDNYIYIEKKDDNSIEFHIENNNSVLERDDDGGFYIEESNKRRTDITLEKEYIELNSVPIVAKVSMKKNTVITTELLTKSDNIVQNDVRKQEYNMIVLPIDLVSGDYIDIRMMLPTGQDYIVISKKEVTIPEIGGTSSEDTIWINMTEDEILHMSCAIVETYQITGAKLYATKYTEAGMQEASTPTYPANAETVALLQNNPNVLEVAMDEVRARYNNTSGTTLRNEYINSLLNAQGEQGQSNVGTGIQESITNSKNSRKEYLDSLAGTVQ